MYHKWHFEVVLYLEIVLEFQRFEIAVQYATT